MTVHHDQTLVRYLLGEMEEQERTAFEDDYFADESLTDRLEAAETELTDAYVHGELTGNRRLAFEQRYLVSDEQINRIETARRLASRATVPPAIASASRASVYRFVALAASLVVVVGAFIAVREMGTTNAPSSVSTPTSSASAETSASPTERPPAVINLSEGSTRSAGTISTISILDGVQVVHLRTELRAQPPGAAYRASITTPEGATVYLTDDVAIDSQETKMLRTVVPASWLRPGDYILTITSTRSGATQVLAEYSFRISPR